MNDSNNNFSLIRNSEINRIGPNYISPIYYQNLQINNVMKEKDAFEDTIYINNHSKIWERDQLTYKHKYCNQIINNDYDKQFCIIGFDSLLHNVERIRELYENTRNDFIVLENKCTIEYLQQRLDNYGFERVKCYNLIGSSSEELINYFKLLYLSVGSYEIIDVEIKKTKFNTNFYNRSQIINQLTQKTNKYLEIGVEYGQTFNGTHFFDKLGVDPDPKFIPTNGKLIKLTSDDYFKNLISNNTSTNNNTLTNNNSIIELNETRFDAIFIDGMHQSEYLLRDINNSINVLTNNGIIFIDDILPFNYNEQLKIPNKHYYEDGILKTGENWTGDVWKVIYHMLLHYYDKINSFKYYDNINYRGVATFKLNEKFQINNDDIDVINNYEYFKDYNNYIKLLLEL